MREVLAFLATVFKRIKPCGVMCGVKFGNILIRSKVPLLFFTNNTKIRLCYEIYK